MKWLSIALLMVCTISLQAQELKKEEPEIRKWFQVEKKAEFPGGDAAMDHFIKNNMVIPDKAYKKAKSGTILVSFVVEKDGSLSNIKITSSRKIGYGVEEAAIDVIKKMPKWSPAMQSGTPCRMAFTKPIRLRF